MSIITEALKKAQKGQSPNLSGYAKSPRQPILGPRLGYQKKSKKHEVGRKNNFLVGGLIFGTLLLLSLALIFGYIQNLQKIYIEKPVLVVPQAKTTTAIPVNTVKAFKEGPLFKLNGIVNDENKPLAVINDKIVETGEIVDGAKVTKINSDKAELSYKGRKIVLQIGD